MNETSDQLATLLRAYQTMAASLRAVSSDPAFDGDTSSEAFQPLDEGAMAACEGALISVANRIADIAEDSERWKEDKDERKMRKQLMFDQVKWVNSQARIAAMMEQRLREQGIDPSTVPEFKKVYIEPGKVEPHNPFNPPGPNNHPKQGPGNV